ncbi:hypothetical protein I4U23_016857 [Adineta vaga]|nr:hypothetical protein I4U23_016857 [Adineta vaga]
MMPTGLIGRAAPCLVHGCTILNKSNSNVFVRILYESIRTEDEHIHERRVEFQLPKDTQIKIDEEEFNMGSFHVRQTIRTIEVNRTNEQIQELNAPFNNVNGVELDWLFIIDDRNIKSIDPNK